MPAQRIRCLTSVPSAFMLIDGKKLSRGTKNLSCLVAGLCLLIFCSPKQDETERIMEDGVEVIINHLEPYKIEGEPSTLHLEEEFTIDTERDEIAKVGLADIRDFDVDSQGNIYFFHGREFDRNVIHKFDKEGTFLKSLGKRGQGPGEIQVPIVMYVTKTGDLPIQDGNTQRLYIFDTEGALIRETRIESQNRIGNLVFYPLINGNYLKYGEYFDPESQHRQNILQLCNSRFEMLKDLDRCDHGKAMPFTQQERIFTPRVFIWQISNGKVYVGHEKRGYDIWVYDLDGHLVKKIRKEYTPADVPEAYKENWLVNIGRYKDKLLFPDKMPPFHYFFLDDNGRLYVKTYEEGTHKDEYMHDIFNSDGLFIARASMAGYGRWIYPGDSLNRGKAKNDRFYCIREKESGFKELVVYKMIWE
jgi:hypothetical protein